MAFDDENEPGDELEDFGDELSSDYKEETEEGLGEEGEEIEEEVSFEIEETVPAGTTVRASNTCGFPTSISASTGSAPRSNSSTRVMISSLVT